MKEGRKKEKTVRFFHWAVSRTETSVRFRLKSSVPPLKQPASSNRGGGILFRTEQYEKVAWTFGRAAAGDSTCPGGRGGAPRRVSSPVVNSGSPNRESPPTRTTARVTC